MIIDGKTIFDVKIQVTPGIPEGSMMLVPTQFPNESIDSWHRRWVHVTNVKLPIIEENPPK